LTYYSRLFPEELIARRARSLYYRLNPGSGRVYDDVLRDYGYFEEAWRRLLLGRVRGLRDAVRRLRLRGRAAGSGVVWMLLDEYYRLEDELEELLGVIAGVVALNTLFRSGPPRPPPWRLETEAGRALAGLLLGYFRLRYRGRTGRDPPPGVLEEARRRVEDYAISLERDSRYLAQEAAGRIRGRRFLRHLVKPECVGRLPRGAGRLRGRRLVRALTRVLRRSPECALAYMHSRLNEMLGELARLEVPYLYVEGR
jgi:hypothetical protein